MTSSEIYLSPDLEKARAHLLKGEPVAIPTETVYGLAAPIKNPQAIEKIFKIKERPFFDPLIVHVSSQEQLVEIVSGVSPLAKRLMDRFWPGPLTIVLPKHASVNPMITSGLNTVAVRMPRHRLTLELLRSVGPLAAPSANKFGRTSPTTAEHVRNEFGTNVFVVDGGPCEVGIESTVIGLSDDSRDIDIYRPGAITAEVLGEFAHVKNKASPAAPGHLEHHYMPQKPLIVLRSKNQISIDAYETLSVRLKKKPNLGWISLNADAALAARELYAALRSADASPLFDVLILDLSDISISAGMKKPADSGLWAAIIDRATKAATLIY